MFFLAVCKPAFDKINAQLATSSARVLSLWVGLNYQSREWKDSTYAKFAPLIKPAYEPLDITLFPPM